MKKNEQGFGAVGMLVVVVIIGLISAVGWLVYDRQKNLKNNEVSNTQATQQEQKQQMNTDEAKPKTLAQGTFGDKGDYGTFDTQGYATTTKVNEPFCFEDCKQYDYIFFKVTKTENTNILNYLNKLNGNSFVQDKAIGMGCIADNQISYYNSSDAKGSQEYKLTKDDTSLIMKATAEKPITLSIERLEFTGGKDAPACYSHFTTFNVTN